MLKIYQKYLISQFSSLILQISLIYPDWNSQNLLMHWLAVNREMRASLYNCNLDNVTRTSIYIYSYIISKYSELIGSES